MNIFEEVFQKEPAVQEQEDRQTAEAQPAVPAEENAEAFDLEKWKEEKKAIRNDVYGFLEEITAALQSGEVDMQQYLNVQAQFMEYSASNALLILAQDADAKKLGSAKFWKDRGAQLKPSAKHIYILEKGTAYQKRDGSIAESYEPREMFDITQTNIKPNNEKQSYTQRSLLTGLVKDFSYPITVQEELSLPVLVGDSTVYYRKNIDFEEGFTWLAYVIAALSMDQSNKPLLNYKAQCVSYILCTALGLSFKMDVQWNDGNPLLHFSQPKAFRQQLKEIRDTACFLYSQIMSQAEAVREEQP